jgi:uncharacterized short protein YbdD (DUF466 family)
MKSNDATAPCQCAAHPSGAPEDLAPSQRDGAGFGGAVLSAFHRAAATARLMIGVPDYEAYRAHRAKMHPGEAVMDYEDFFRERQASRYGANGGKISRCC